MVFPVDGSTNGITDGKNQSSSIKYKKQIDDTMSDPGLSASIAESLAMSQSSSTGDLPLLTERKGDVISSHKALLTLAKGFVGTGCFSLPYAWKLGGLWVSFVLQFVISGLNWYSNHILAKAAQYLARKSSRSALDYGHFAKKVFDYSGYDLLQRHSKKSMYIVNFTVLLYQLGCSSVPIVFVATNLRKLFGHYLHVHMSNTFYATMLLMPLAAFNMAATMNALSYLAITATFLWLGGAAVMLQYCFQMPNQWSRLPASTDLWSTTMFFGLAMYSYEGQTMILPIENKMRYPEEFTENFGVLPTLMGLITALYTSIGFYGYTAFGDNVLGTLPLNMPENALFTSVTVMLICMAFLAHPVNLYVVYDMFWPGVKRKVPARFPFWRERVGALNITFRMFWVFLTYLLAVFVPRVEQIVSLVGITGGSLCAFVYPPILEILTFRTVWTLNKSRWFILAKISFNFLLISLGLFLCVFGMYVNLVEIFRDIGV